MENTLQHLKNLGVQELRIAGGQAVAVNPYEADKGRRYTAWFNKQIVLQDLPPLPCAESVKEGTYPIGQLKEQWQIQMHSGNWRDIKHKNEHNYSFKRCVLVLSEPVAESERYQDKDEKVSSCDCRIGGQWVGEIYYQAHSYGCPENPLNKNDKKMEHYKRDFTIELPEKAQKEADRIIEAIKQADEVAEKPEGESLEIKRIDRILSISKIDTDGHILIKVKEEQSSFIIINKDDAQKLTNFINNQLK